MNELYYPFDDTYEEDRSFHFWKQAYPPPDPCRKYHISSELSCAAQVAKTVLPLLREMKLFHKVVSSKEKLQRMQAGGQAGKFITVYAPEDINDSDFILRISNALARLPGARPSSSTPGLRGFPKSHFRELPRDPGMFIYGGYVKSPYE